MVVFFIRHTGDAAKYSGSVVSAWLWQQAIDCIQSPTWWIVCACDPTYVHRLAAKFYGQTRDR